MDPVTIVVTALATGAADAAKDAVASLYGRLKAALAERFGDDPAASKTLEKHAGDPEGYDAPMRDAVAESGAADDAAIVALARELLATADPAGAQVGRYNVQVRDSKGTVIGDNATVTQTFT